MNIAIIVIGIIVGIIIFISPFIGLLATVALIPLSVIQAFAGSVFGIFTVATPIKIIGVLTFISAFARHVFKSKRWDFLKKPQIVFFILFLVWLIISGFAHPGEFTRENFTAFISFALLGFIIISLINSIKKFRLLVWIALIAVFIVCLNDIFSYLNVYQATRLMGAAYGPNEFAIGLLPFVGVAFYSAFYERKKILKVIMFIIAITAAGALILTVSRGGIIGLAGMLLIGALKAKKKIKAILFLILIAILFVNFIPQQVWGRYKKTEISEKYTGDEVVTSTTRRFYLAKAAWQMFLVNPFFGVGPGNYYYECRLYQPVYAGRAHNMYLEILAELGIMGFILFLGVLFYTFKILKRIRKSNLSESSYGWGLYIGLIGFLIAAIFLHAQQEKVLWLVIFMAVALEGIIFNNKNIGANRKKCYEK